MKPSVIPFDVLLLPIASRRWLLTNNDRAGANFIPSSIAVVMMMDTKNKQLSLQRQQDNKIIFYPRAKDFYVFLLIILLISLIGDVVRESGKAYIAAGDPTSYQRSHFVSKNIHKMRLTLRKMVMSSIDALIKNSTVGILSSI
jgi:hypothetical protein